MRVSQRARYPGCKELDEALERFRSRPLTFHWRRIHSTNPMERLLREVGIFPNPQAALWLIGAVLVEQQDEWEAGRRYFSLASMAALYGAQ